MVAHTYIVTWTRMEASIGAEKWLDLKYVLKVELRTRGRIGCRASKRAMKDSQVFD